MSVFEGILSRMLKGTYLILGDFNYSDIEHLLKNGSMDKVLIVSKSQSYLGGLSKSLENDALKIVSLFHVSASELVCINEGVTFDFDQVSVVLVESMGVFFDFMNRHNGGRIGSIPVIHAYGGFGDNCYDEIFSTSGYLVDSKNCDEVSYLSCAVDSKKFFDVKRYWQSRYSSGGNSGSGSYSRLAEFKSKFINGFLRDKNISSVVEFGCGDGAQLGLISYPKYKGLDISAEAISRCERKYSEDPKKSFFVYRPNDFNPNGYLSELSISLDVIYHISSDELYEKYLRDLFSTSTKYVVIYANYLNFEGFGVNSKAGYIRFRDVVSDVAELYPEWRLKHIESNRYPYNQYIPNHTSFSDFFIYSKVDGEGGFNLNDYYYKRNFYSNLVFGEYIEERINKVISGVGAAELSLSKEINDFYTATSESLERNRIDLISLRDLISEMKAENESISRLRKELNASEAANKKVRASESYRLGRLIVSGIKMPLIKIRRIKRFIMSAWLKKKITKIQVNVNKKNISEALGAYDYSALEGVEVIVYADINLNIIDGSSVWLVSLVKTLSLKRKVCLLLKSPVKNDFLVGDLQGMSNVILVKPDVLFSEDRSLTVMEAIWLLRKIDMNVSSIQRVFVRGVSVASELLSTRQFQFRVVVYLTDVYSYTKGTISSSNEQIRELKNIARRADTFLFQTREIKNYIEGICGRELCFLDFPPPLPNIPCKAAREISSGVVNIVYAGKIAPKWGVEELISWVGILKEQGLNCNLKIISNKISLYDYDGNEYRSKVLEMIKLSGAEYIKGASRDEVIAHLYCADYIWCYRPSELEDNVLEVSTKLLEAICSGGRALVYPSALNKNILGEDYPYYIKSRDDFLRIINSPSAWDGRDLAGRIYASSSQEALADRLDSLFSDRVDVRNILFAGHDFKFIDAYISSLKLRGYKVKVDVWQWGAGDLKVSREMLGWADAVFCEWGLANAQWYSHEVGGKKLIVRCHAQEVRERALRFGRAINYNSVSSLLYVSTVIKDRAEAIFDLSQVSKSVVSNYVLGDEFFPVEKTHTSKIRLGMCGIIPESKRFDLAVDVLSVFLSKGIDAELHVKGYKPQELEWMQVASRANEMKYYESIFSQIEKNPDLNSRIIFHGFGWDVATWYEKIDYIISPSDHESFHYAAVDGVLSGCLPVVWNWNGAKEIFGEAAIVDSTSAAVELIEQYHCMPPEQLAEIKVLARSSILKRFGSEKIFSQLDSQFFD